MAPSRASPSGRPPAAGRRQGQAFPKWQGVLEEDTSHQPCPPSSSQHPAWHLAELDSSGHLAKGGQRKGTSHASSARVVIELNESLFLAWLGIGSGCKDGDISMGLFNSRIFTTLAQLKQPGWLPQSLLCSRDVGAVPQVLPFWGCPFMPSSHQAWGAALGNPNPTITAEQANKTFHGQPCLDTHVQPRPVCAQAEKSSRLFPLPCPPWDRTPASHRSHILPAES